MKRRCRLFNKEEKKYFLEKAREKTPPEELAQYFHEKFRRKNTGLRRILYFEAAELKQGPYRNIFLYYARRIAKEETQKICKRYRHNPKNREKIREMGTNHMIRYREKYREQYNQYYRSYYSIPEHKKKHSRLGKKNYKKNIGRERICSKNYAILHEKERKAYAKSKEILHGQKVNEEKVKIREEEKRKKLQKLERKFQRSIERILKKDEIEYIRELLPLLELGLKAKGEGFATSKVTGYLGVSKQYMHALKKYGQVSYLRHHSQIPPKIMRPLLEDLIKIEPGIAEQIIKKTKNYRYKDEIYE